MAMPEVYPMLKMTSPWAFSPIFGTRRVRRDGRPCGPSRSYTSARFPGWVAVPLTQVQRRAIKRVHNRKGRRRRARDLDRLAQTED